MIFFNVIYLFIKKNDKSIFIYRLHIYKNSLLFKRYIIYNLLIYFKNKLH